MLINLFTCIKTLHPHQPSAIYRSYIRHTKYQSLTRIESCRFNMAARNKKSKMAETAVTRMPGEYEPHLGVILHYPHIPAVWRGVNGDCRYGRFAFREVRKISGHSWNVQKTRALFKSKCGAIAKRFWLGTLGRFFNFQ